MGMPVVNRRPAMALFNENPVFYCERCFQTSLIAMRTLVPHRYKNGQVTPPDTDGVDKIIQFAIRYLNDFAHSLHPITQWRRRVTSATLPNIRHDANRYIVDPENSNDIPLPAVFFECPQCGQAMDLVEEQIRICEEKYHFGLDTDMEDKIPPGCVLCRTTNVCSRERSMAVSWCADCFNYSSSAPDCRFCIYNFGRMELGISDDEIIEAAIKRLG